MFSCKIADKRGLSGPEAGNQKKEQQGQKVSENSLNGLPSRPAFESWKAVIILSFILTATAAVAYLIYHANLIPAKSHQEHDDHVSNSSSDQAFGRLPRQGKSLLNMKMSFVQEEGSLEDLVPLENWYPIPKGMSSEADEYYPLEFEITTVDEELAMAPPTTLKTTSDTPISTSQAENEGVTEKIFVILPAEVIGDHYVVKEEKDSLEKSGSHPKSFKRESSFNHEELSQDPDITLDKMFQVDEVSTLMPEEDHVPIKDTFHVDGFYIGNQGPVKTLEEELEEILHNQYQLLMEEKMKHIQPNLGPVERLLQLLQESLQRSQSSKNQVKQENVNTRKESLDHLVSEEIFDGEMDPKFEVSTEALPNEKSYSIESLADEFRESEINTPDKLDNYDIFKRISNYSNFLPEQNLPPDRPDQSNGLIQTLNPVVVNTELKLDDLSPAPEEDAKKGDSSSENSDEYHHWMLPTPRQKLLRKSGLSKHSPSFHVEPIKEMDSRISYEDSESEFEEYSMTTQRPISEFGSSLQNLLAKMQQKTLEVEFPKEILSLEDLAIQENHHLKATEEDRSSQEVPIVEQVKIIQSSETKSKTASWATSLPSLATFTVGSDESYEDNSEVVETPSTLQSSKSEIIQVDDHFKSSKPKVLATETVTGFLDFVTTIADTVLIFTPQIGKASSPQIVESDTQVHIVEPSKSSEPDFEVAPSIGIEELFRDFERPLEERIQTEPTIESSFAINTALPIEPSSVSRTDIFDEPNDVFEQETAQNPLDFKINYHPPIKIEGISQHSAMNTIETRVQSSTIFSNFIPGEKSIGMITSTGNTQIVNGVTTVNAFLVEGTYLGEIYAQIIHSSAQILKETITPTETGFAGIVQYVSEKPTFGVEVAGIEQEAPVKKKEQNLAGLFGNSLKVPSPDTGILIKQGQATKSSRNNINRERLRDRLQKYKTQGSLDDGIVGRGSVSQIDPALILRGPKTFLNDQVINLDANLNVAERRSSGRSLSFKGLNKRNFKGSAENQNKSDESSTLSPKPQFESRSGYIPRTNFKSGKYRNSSGNHSKQADTQDTESSAESNELPEQKDSPDSNQKRKIVLKSFEKFNRPDIRRSLLEKLLHRNRAANKTSEELNYQNSSHEPMKNDDVGYSELNIENENHEPHKENEDIENNSLIDVVTSIKPSSVEAATPLIPKTEIYSPSNDILSSKSTILESSLLELASGIETIVKTFDSTTQPIMTRAYEERSQTLSSGSEPFYNENPDERQEFLAYNGFRSSDEILEEARSESHRHLVKSKKGERELSKSDQLDTFISNTVQVSPPDQELSTKNLNSNHLNSLFSNGNPLSGLTADQIQQLALWQYYQNVGVNNKIPDNNIIFSQDLISSTPVYKTSTLFSTRTIPLIMGAKKIFTTLFESIGMTTITDYETFSVTQPPNFKGRFQIQTAPVPIPTYSETSHPVIKETEFLSTILKEIRITYRNTPTIRTLTSTTLVSSKVTSFITKTVKVQPTRSFPFG